ncbi:MAG: LOW QUALITY PROTEIN: hypothetical protein J3Q66DRAFT_340069 [Benniella sp.]|nr:MAG: LOW QUALITY PROTEIN: hypothetical protein J3Q66DRAFT_340069 [Benniella sp.]
MGLNFFWSAPTLILFYLKSVTTRNLSQTGQGGYAGSYALCESSTIQEEQYRAAFRFRRVFKTFFRKSCPLHKGHLFPFTLPGQTDSVKTRRWMSKHGDSHGRF